MAIPIKTILNESNLISAKPGKLGPESHTRLEKKPAGAFVRPENLIQENCANTGNGDPPTNQSTEIKVHSRVTGLQLGLPAISIRATCTENGSMREDILSERRVFTGKEQGYTIFGGKKITRSIVDAIIALNDQEKCQGKNLIKTFLLAGIPGVGKTAILESIMRDAACYIKKQTNLFYVTPAMIFSKWIGESEKLTKVLFQVAQDCGPSVIFFDEVDGLMRNRTDGESDSNRRFKTNLLQALEGITKYSGVIIVGATNRPTELDSGFLRRFKIKLEVPLPGSDDRFQIFKQALYTAIPNTVTGNPKEFYDLVLERTEGFSGSDIVNGVLLASKNTFQRTYKGKILDDDDVDDLHSNLDDDAEPVRGIYLDLTVENVITKGLMKMKTTVNSSQVDEIHEWAMQHMTEDDITEMANHRRNSRNAFLGCLKGLCKCMCCCITLGNRC